MANDGFHNSKRYSPLELGVQIFNFPDQKVVERKGRWRTYQTKAHCPAMFFDLCGLPFLLFGEDVFMERNGNKFELESYISVLDRFFKSESFYFEANTLWNYFENDIKWAGFSQIDFDENELTLINDGIYRFDKRFSEKLKTTFELHHSDWNLVFNYDLADKLKKRK